MVSNTKNDIFNFSLPLFVSSVEQLIYTKLTFSMNRASRRKKFSILYNLLIDVKNPQTMAKQTVKTDGRVEYTAQIFPWWEISSKKKKNIKRKMLNNKREGTFVSFFYHGPLFVGRRLHSDWPNFLLFWEIEISSRFNGLLLLLAFSIPSQILQKNLHQRQNIQFNDGNGRNYCWRFIWVKSETEFFPSLFLLYFLVMY